MVKKTVTGVVEKELNPDEIKALKLYAGNKCSRQEAWRKAHPNTTANVNTIRKKACLFFQDPRVVKQLDKLRKSALRRIEISIQKVIEEDAKIAFSDIRQLFDEQGSMLPVQKWGDNIAAAVSSIKCTTDKFGNETVEVKFWNKDSALDKLFKHLGMYQLDNNQKNPFAERLKLIPKDSMRLMLEKLSEAEESGKEEK